MSTSLLGRRMRRPYGRARHASPLRLGRAAWGGGLATAVAAERAGRGELAELVPDHVLLHEHLDELVPVVNLERVPDEFRDDRARPSPRLDRLLRPTLVQHRDLPEQLLRDERAFLCASAHCFSRGRSLFAAYCSVTR